MAMTKLAQAALEKKVETALLRRFPGARFEVDWSPNRIRMGGLLVSDLFRGMDRVERHRQIWEALTGVLDATEQARMTAIFTATPHELAVMDAEPQFA